MAHLDHFLVSVSVSLVSTPLVLLVLAFLAVFVVAVIIIIVMLVVAAVQPLLLLGVVLVGGGQGPLRWGLRWGLGLRWGGTRHQGMLLLGLVLVDGEDALDKVQVLGGQDARGLIDGEQESLRGNGECHWWWQDEEDEEDQKEDDLGGLIEVLLLFPGGWSLFTLSRGKAPP